MQQQAALMAAANVSQGGATPAYLANPATMSALAAAQVQHVNPLAIPNGLSSAAITPTTTGKDSPSTVATPILGKNS